MFRYSFFTFFQYRTKEKAGSSCQTIGLKCFKTGASIENSILIKRYNEIKC